MRKFVRRNRGPVLASTFVLLAVLGGIVGTTLGLFEAQHQRDNAVQARQNEAEQRRTAVDERDRAEMEKATADRLWAEKARLTPKTSKRWRRGSGKSPRASAASKKWNWKRASHIAVRAAQVWRVAGIWDRQPDFGLDLLQDIINCPPAMRDFTWRLYQRLCQCERRELQGHTDVVSCLATSARTVSGWLPEASTERSNCGACPKASSK